MVQPSSSLTLFFLMGLTIYSEKFRLLRGITMQLLIILIWLSAIFVIFFAFYKALTLKRKIPGGLVKKSWTLLYYLIGLLAVGYLSIPLFPELPETSRNLIVGIISLAGAIFIVKVLNLFYKIIKEVGL